jgi:hypothetical protein
VKLFPAPGERRRLALLCCVFVAVAAAAPIVSASREEHGRWLKGTTEQGRRMDLWVDEDGKLRVLKTQIRTLCRGDYHWRVGWNPSPGWGRFTQRGARVTVRELQSQADRRVLGRLTGSIEGGSASGTVRASARFYRDGREVQACESGAVRWAAGPDAERIISEVPPAPSARGYHYAPVPSLAGRVSAARRRFIQRTDQTCAITYGATNAAARAMRRAQGDPERRADAYRAYLEAHTSQLRAIEALGSPPDGVASHRRWLDNFRERVRLEGELLRRLERGALEEADAIDARIGRLKMAGNTRGQRFGLRICTSNGPARTPIPY